MIELGTDTVVRLLKKDKNDDGKLSKDEVPRGMIALLEGADRNGDRFLDEKELQEIVALRLEQQEQTLAAARRAAESMSAKPAYRYLKKQPRAKTRRAAESMVAKPAW